MQCTLDNVHSMLGWYCKGKVQGGHCLGGGGGHIGESRSGILIALHTLLAALTYIPDEDEDPPLKTLPCITIIASRCVQCALRSKI